MAVVLTFSTPTSQAAPIGAKRACLQQGATLVNQMMFWQPHRRMYIERPDLVQADRMALQLAYEIWDVARSLPNLQRTTARFAEIVVKLEQCYGLTTYSTAIFRTYEYVPQRAWTHP